MVPLLLLLLVVRCGLSRRRPSDGLGKPRGEACAQQVAELDELQVAHHLGTDAQEPRELAGGEALPVPPLADRGRCRRRASPRRRSRSRCHCCCRRRRRGRGRACRRRRRWVFFRWSRRRSLLSSTRHLDGEGGRHAVLHEVASLDELRRLWHTHFCVCTGTGRASMHAGIRADSDDRGPTHNNNEAHVSRLQRDEGRDHESAPAELTC